MNQISFTETEMILSTESITKYSVSQKITPLPALRPAVL